MSLCYLQLYRGYANNDELIVSGHVFSKYPTSQSLYDREGFRNLSSIFQLFSIKTISNIKIVFKMGNITSVTRTLKDGYFRFSIPLTASLPSGWHSYSVTVSDTVGNHTYDLTNEGEILVPYAGAYSIISDIDDTFLISYTSKFFKKLYVLFSKNVEARQPFEGVVKHYRLLSFAGKVSGIQQEENTFFYVSSSEWNLYQYIVRFTQFYGLPKAVFKLKRIKTGIMDFFRTGRGSHNHKQDKIAHIIEFYPHLKFILMGDDSQQDPIIYERICKLFPENIRAVYIRQTRKDNSRAVEKIIDNIQSMGVDTCYFLHSREAIEHSVRTRIITAEQLAEFEAKEHKNELTLL